MLQHGCYELTTKAGIAKVLFWAGKEDRTGEGRGRAGVGGTGGGFHHWLHGPTQRPSHGVESGMSSIAQAKESYGALHNIHRFLCAKRDSQSKRF